MSSLNDSFSSNCSRGSQETQSLKFARNAHTFEKNSQFKMAMFYYTEAIQWLINENGDKPFSIVDEKRSDLWLTKIESLRNIVNSPSDFQKNEDFVNENEFKRIRYILDEALTYDEAADYAQALVVYTRVVEKTIEFKNKPGCDKWKQQTHKWATHCLDRAEAIKNMGNAETVPIPVTKKLSKISLTPYEKRIIIKGSIVDGNKFPPFICINCNEKYSSATPFVDPDGFLKFSPKQRTFKNVTWKRPGEFLNDPKIICQVSPFSIKQNLVNDCAFMSSLSACAQYQRFHNTPLITNIIYPKNAYEEPIYNPCGKYTVRLNFNGIFRKVTVDDFLPVVETEGRMSLLSSYSLIPNELWVSILEKAFLKVMGGYGMESSMAFKDMNMITGWIPERLSFTDIEFDVDSMFKIFINRFHKGDCLLVASSSKDVDEERTGIVGEHAYAILDVKFVEGHKLFLMKNPWNEKRWKGNFSVDDEVNWTNSLRKTLKFNQKLAKIYDNGIFWIDLKSVVKFFRSVDINWNPKIFPHTATLHDTWNLNNGPTSCAFTIRDNPQYKIYLKGNGKKVVWVHIARHGNLNNATNEFIGLVVYKNYNTLRIYEPEYPKPYKDGVRSNSPHYLVKLMEEDFEVELTLVVTQITKTTNLNYTLNAYSTCHFQLSRMQDIFKDSHHIQASDLWFNCPKIKNMYSRSYKMQIDDTTPLLLKLSTQKEIAIGLKIYPQDSRHVSLFSTDNVYRHGCCFLEVGDIEPALYDVEITTYDDSKVNNLSTYNLDIQSIKPIKFF